MNTIQPVKTGVRFLATAAAPASRPAKTVAASLAVTRETNPLGYYSSLLPPANVPGIRRAPRRVLPEQLPGTEGQLKVGMPNEGGWEFQWINARLDRWYITIKAVLFVTPFALLSLTHDRSRGGH